MIIKRKLIHALLYLLLSAVTIYGAKADISEMNTLFNGEISFPVKIHVSSPEFRRLSQFSRERTDSLNRIIKHISMDISIDGQIYETTLYADDEALVTVREKDNENGKLTVYSLQPDTLYQSAGNTDTDSFGQFLENEFFLLNRMLDDLYPVFEKSGQCFPDHTKTSSSGMNYKEFGKAVKKVILQFPADYVKENFPGKFSELCDNDTCRQFIEQFQFKGTQKIVMLYDQNGQMICVSYSGILGTSEESFRKVSLSWKCLRETDRKKDSVTLKTPSIKGYDKYNMTYIRNLDISDPDNQKIFWDYQLDMKYGNEKKKLMFSSDMYYRIGKLTGTIQFTEKQNGQDQNITVIPEIEQEKSREYSGTIEITFKKGKIEISSVRFLLRLSPSEALSAPDSGKGKPVHTDTEPGKLSEEELQMMIDRTIIRALLALPEEDTVFFRQDIPGDIWKSIIQSMY